MYDAHFARHFRIHTSIRYLPDLVIEKGKEELFRASWKKAYPKAHDGLSRTRSERFEGYMRHIKKQGDEKYAGRVAIRYLGPKVGYGVFAKEEIAPYSTLGHYTGILRLEEEISATSDSTFSFDDFPRFSIDAKKSGNWTRFMNHGEERSEKTNVRSWEYYTPEMPYILFTAGAKGIKKGAQLLYSYGDKYWHEKSFHQF